jgi:hypothetical protein
MKCKDIVSEDYVALVKQLHNKKTYPIFVNPSRSEIKELAREENLARFIAFNGHFYLFNASLLHATAIEKLGLPLSSSPSINDAFLGVAKASLYGALEYYDSNQISDEQLESVSKAYRYIAKYFTM